MNNLTEVNNTTERKIFIINVGKISSKKAEKLIKKFTRELKDNSWYRKFLKEERLKKLKKLNESHM